MMKLIQVLNCYSLERSFHIWGAVGTNQSAHRLIEGGFSYAAFLEGREDQKDLREVSIFISVKVSTLYPDRTELLRSQCSCSFIQK